jgi:hypothetical protein
VIRRSGAPVIVPKCVSTSGRARPQSAGQMTRPTNGAITAQRDVRGLGRSVIVQAFGGTAVVGFWDARYGARSVPSARLPDVCVVALVKGLRNMRGLLW